MSSKLWIILLLVIAEAYLQETGGRNNIGSCARLRRTDFGTWEAPSDRGIVAQSLQLDNGGTEDSVRVLEVSILCEAAGLRRDTASSISALVTYECNGTTCGEAPVNRTEQFQLDCFSDVNGDSFFPLRVEFGTVRTPDPSSTHDTPSNSRCGLCADPSTSGIATEASTYCFGCPSDCVGQKRCVGVNSEQCCNWYLEGVCVLSCPMPLQGDPSTFDCGCGALSANNSNITFSSGFSVGSIATHTCDATRGYVLQVGTIGTEVETERGYPPQSSTRVCATTGWTGPQISCIMFDCGSGDIIPPQFGEVSITSTTFGSVATFMCRAGYALKGNITRTCTLRGWTGSNPICEFTCSSNGIAAPEFGQVSFPSNLLDSVATFACDAGCELKGSPTRMCTLNGWNGANPTCACSDKEIIAVTANISSGVHVTGMIEGANALLIGIMPLLMILEEL